tara:strand:- start:44 stop:1264 length:1221 start_codon:yes stop_codon:yes gene_type:complete
MTNFEGKNDLGSTELFYQRLKYSQQAFPRSATSLYLHPIRDFNFAEYMLYGRINKNHNPISLVKTGLKRIEKVDDPKAEVAAVNFVADAFAQVVQEFEKASVQGKLDSSDPFLYNLKAYAGHINLQSVYNNYRDSLKRVFFDVFLTSKRNQRILNFRSFVPVFLEYIADLTESSVLTTTAFTTTKFCPPAVSGLVISVSDLDPTNDEDKESFITSPNFQYYLEVLKKHGFFVNKNRPWELVADIANPFMLQYAAVYGLNTENDVLKVNYQRLGASDIEELKRFAFDLYNELSLTKRFVRTVVNNRKARVCRKTIRFEEIEQIYPENFWLDKYIDIRYAEQELPISEGDIVSLKKNIPSILATQGMTAALTLINDKLNGFANYSGSFAKIVVDRESIRTGRNLSPTY